MDGRSRKGRAELAGSGDRMPDTAQFKFNPKALVRRIGHQEARTVEAQMEKLAPDENMYSIQLGNDAANRVWAKESELELVADAPAAESGPRFVPTRSIMD